MNHEIHEAHEKGLERISVCGGRIQLLGKPTVWVKVLSIHVFSPKTEIRTTDFTDDTNSRAMFFNVGSFALTR
jgi:hypothetical protein